MQNILFSWVAKRLSKSGFALPLVPASSVVVIIIIVRHEKLIFLEKCRHLFADPRTNIDSCEDSDEELEEAESR